jgi:hypothetical protein
MADNVNNIGEGGKTSGKGKAKYRLKVVGGDLKDAIEKDLQHANRIKNTAEIMGCTERYVRYVVGGERVNDQIFACYMELQEGETKLIQSVKELVPFDI